MPRVSKETKEQIKALPKEDLQAIVIKLASQKDNFDYILVNYLDTEFGEKDLYEETINDLKTLFFKSYKGFSDELRLANMLSACTKRINEFTKNSKNKKLEADLILFVLNEPFSMSLEYFGTCFTKYDYRVSILLKRLITIVTKKLHEDYLIEYRNQINEYLEILHKNSDFNDFVYSLPDSI